MNYIYRFLLFVWLFLMLNFSGDFTGVKFFFLGGLLCLSLLIFCYEKTNLSLKFISSILTILCLFLASYLYGLHNGFLFSDSLFLSVIITPVIALILSSVVDGNRIEYVKSCLVVNSFLVVVINLTYMLSVFDILPFESIFRGFNTFGGTSLDVEKLEVRLTSQPSLVFLLPFISTLFIFDKKTNKKFLGLILLLGMLVVILSGRKVLQILFFVGLIFNVFLYYKKTNLKLFDIIKVFLSISVVVFCMHFVFEIISFFTNIKNPSTAFFNTVMRAFDSSNHGGAIRFVQTKELYDFFSGSPLFGNGLNSHPLYIRNSAEPWSYEWVYLAFLGQVGILVSFITFASVIFIAKRMLSLMLASQEYGWIFAGFLNGYICFIIAGSTNPMIYFVWFWFLALIPFNSYWSVGRN